jgi:hypothetical protein
MSRSHRYHSSAVVSLEAERNLLSPLQMNRMSLRLEVQHANPLEPLRPRDGRALDTFFKSDRIQEITLDIHQYLARAYPEPCWEDEPYEFLRGYI